MSETGEGGTIEVDLEEAVVGAEGVDDWRETDPEIEMLERFTDEEGEDWEDED